MEDSLNYTGYQCFSFDRKIYSIAAAVSAATGCLSFLACCFTVAVIVLFKKTIFFSQRLILYLAIAAAVLSLSTVLYRVDYENQTSAPYNNFCIFSGFLNQVASWMVLNAVTSITTSLFARAILHRRPEVYEPLFILFIFAFPFTFNWIPFIRLSYGRAGAWCWIRSTEHETCKRFLFGQILQLVLWYLPLYLTILVLVVLYSIIVCKLYCSRKPRVPKISETSQAENKMKTIKEVTSLVAYPLIYFLVNIPPLINRIQEADNPQNPQPVLWFLSGIFSSLQGGIIALAFSLNPETRKRLTTANFVAALRHSYRSKGVYDYPLPMENNHSTLNEELLQQAPTQHGIMAQ